MNITLDKFRGTVPKIEPRLLSGEYAQISTNVRYESGALMPIKEFNKLEASPKEIDAYAIYKYMLTPTTHKWLYFDKNVMLAKDPLYKTEDNRVVISGLDAPRIFDSAVVSSTNTITDSNSFLLGLPYPNKASIAVSSAGTGAFESRAYTVQYDRLWSDGKIDQGPLSVPAETSGGVTYVDMTSNGTATISNIADAPVGYGITHITLNRTGTSLQDSSFYFVKTFNIADAKSGAVSGVTWNAGTSTFTIIDDVSSEDLGGVCINQDYISPDIKLSGIIPVTGGMLAGYYDNFVCFSEPYQCHAWPEQYKVAIDAPVVGIGTFGDIVVVCTEAEPYIINIQDPMNAVAFPIREFAPCISAEGIVSYRDAVVYPSIAGFVRVDRLGVASLTLNLADIHDMKDFDMHIVRAAGLGPHYYVLYTTSNNQIKMLILDMQNPDQGFGMCDLPIQCMYADFAAATLYCVYKDALGDSYLGEYDSGSQYVSCVWKSKIFALPEDVLNFSAARVRSAAFSTESSTDFTTVDYAVNEESYNEHCINGLRAAETDTGLTLYYFMDGDLVFSKRITSHKPFRLPAGRTCREVEIMLVGNTPVYRVDLATSMYELTE